MDLTGRHRGRWVTDCFGLTENELQAQFPRVYQHLLERVLPERQHNNRPSYREQWWVFSEPRQGLRLARSAIEQCIVTPRTAKHRFFLMMPSRSATESEVVSLALGSFGMLSVLSSRLHVHWALSFGGTLEDRPRYNSECLLVRGAEPMASTEQEDLEIDGSREN
jgi:hypothetical protein